MRGWIVACLAVAMASTWLGVDTIRADNPPGARPQPPAPPAQEDPTWDPVTEQGQNAVGVYIPAVFVARNGLRGVIDLVQHTRSNAVVIDMKDGAGRVTYDTNIAILEESQHDYLGDVGALIRGLKAEGIYTIARITCFADPQLPQRHPERSIQHHRRHTPWTSWGTGNTWLDPYNRENHAMIVELTREAEAFGYDEIQLDYVRFPVD
ncbi:MAG: putative glycoside hydrolase, partial [Polyangiales bacterium]